MLRHWLALLFVISQPLSAKAVRLESVTDPNVASGCYFSEPGSKKQILITSARSNESGGHNTAYVRINGAKYTLGLSGEKTAGVSVYQSSDVRLELSNWREIPPVCKSTECEGSFYSVLLKVRKGSNSSRLNVRAHCGA